MLKAKFSIPNSSPLLSLLPPPRPQSVEHLASHLLSLLKQCNSVTNLKQIHARMLISSVHKPNHLLAKLVELKDLSYASLHFSQIPHPNDFSFNLMIRGLTTSWCNYALALHFHLQMVKSGEKPNSYTYPFVLIASANLQALQHGRAAHASVFKIGIYDNDHTQHSLITMYARCREMDSARKVFDEIGEKDLVSWNSMISGYAKMGFAGEAVGLFRAMGVEGWEPNEVTLVSVLAACGDLGNLSMGRWLEGCVEATRFQLNSFLGSALIDMYGKCGDLVAARRIFDGILKKDVVLWNAMITGYAQNGMSNEAIAVFHAMREARVNPDKITLVGVLSSCAAVGAVQLGTRLDEYASQMGLYDNVYVGTALVDMYGKCGNLDKAIQVFNNMPHKNEATWNAMICALAFHGRGEEAIQFFNEMRYKEHIRPNDITFIGVLAACVHSGLVEEGRHWFNSLEPVFQIVPKIEHYSCMVDLLARAGHVEEAWEFIEKMPEKPDAVVLGALLGACRKCRNVEVGERVMNNIFELEPSNSWNYLISSKIYASSKRWDDSAKMRGLMRERGISKTPGCSWIEVNGEVHEFYAGEGVQLKAADIYQVIEILAEEMKLEGYTPNVDLL